MITDEQLAEIARVRGEIDHPTWACAWRRWREAMRAAYERGAARAERLAKWVAENHPIQCEPDAIDACGGCGRLVDLSTCHCGEAVDRHGFGSGHSAVPMGCVCGYQEVEVRAFPWIDNTTTGSPRCRHGVLLSYLCPRCVDDGDYDQ